MRTPDPTRSKFALHGPAIEIACEVPAMAGQIRRLFEPFAVNGWPEGFIPTIGIIRPYAQSEVLRHLSPTARPVHTGAELIELYEDGDRFWLVDDRWGMCGGQPHPRPVPQLGDTQPARRRRPRRGDGRSSGRSPSSCGAKGLYLLPAVSVVRDGWAVMIICPFSIESELVALIRAGYKVIGQRWTAVREEDGRLALLHLPGADRAVVRPPPALQLRDAASVAGHDLGRPVVRVHRLLAEPRVLRRRPRRRRRPPGQRRLHPRRRPRRRAGRPPPRLADRRTSPPPQVRPAPAQARPARPRLRAATVPQPARPARPPAGAARHARGQDGQRHRPRAGDDAVGRTPAGRRRCGLVRTRVAARRAT